MEQLQVSLSTQGQYLSLTLVSASHPVAKLGQQQQLRMRTQGTVLYLLLFQMLIACVQMPIHALHTAVNICPLHYSWE